MRRLGCGARLRGLLSRHAAPMRTNSCQRSVRSVASQAQGDASSWRCGGARLSCRRIRASTYATYRSPPGTPTHAPPCATTEPAQPRPAPQLRARCVHGLRHVRGHICDEPTDLKRSGTVSSQTSRARRVSPDPADDRNVLSSSTEKNLKHNKCSATRVQRSRPEAYVVDFDREVGRWNRLSRWATSRTTSRFPRSE
jgi:hypothetical protein